LPGAPWGKAASKGGKQSLILPKSPQGQVSDRGELDNTSNDKRRCNMTTRRVWIFASVLVVALLMTIGSWEVAKAQEESIQAFDEREKDKLVPCTCYDIDKGEDLDEEVTLKTQFERVDVKIKGPRFLCVPTIIKPETTMIMPRVTMTTMMTMTTITMKRFWKGST
jgi:hypothetical protein